MSDSPEETLNHVDLITPPCSRRSSAHISRKSSWGTPIPGPSAQEASTATVDDGDAFDTIDLGAKSCILEEVTDAAATWNAIENIASLGLSFGTEDSPRMTSIFPKRFSLEDADPVDPTQLLQPRRFDKWLRNLQRKATEKQTALKADEDGYALDRDCSGLENKNHGISGHKKSLSGSSYGFVTAVKSASISLASLSAPPRSRKTEISSRYPKTDRSSRASNIGIRSSEDSSCLAIGASIDEAVKLRSIQRRQVLEEIITTEEGYIADVKFLMNVYVTLLASIPTISLNLRMSINKNLTEIVELHEELLGDLHRIVPHSEYTQSKCSLPVPVTSRAHRRFQSLDVPQPLSDLPQLQKIPGITAEATVAAEVAKIFGQKMHRFFVYEEYGAKYEMMVRDVASTYSTIPQWDVYQKGLEALGKSLDSLNSQHEHLKKSLTLGDLLVKPIQRVCRYPLMFAELLKQTPVCDCPDSHMEIEKVLARLRETTGEINRATDDPRMKATMEKTWMLQDRLVLAGQINARSKNVIRTLGHIHLCGVLHVTWQTRVSVDGQHMISLLYKDCLVLASAGKSDHSYSVKAIIGLSEVRVEEADNGRGLQCHTAPYSWKVVFESDHQLFEMIFNACSPKEELEWRSRLIDRACKEQSDGFEQAFFTILALEIKPMGTVFGKPGTIARRISIHRATTIGPKSSLCQVIIKNTSSLKDNPHCPSSSTINRSQSLLTTNRIPVLAPSRAERIRLENLLSDVWTRDILPFPGMAGRTRSEHLVRSSASSMMRKLSVASITSNFSKRSTSYNSLASIHRLTDEKQEDDAAKNPYSGGWENILHGTSSSDASVDTATSRLSVIQDENSPFEEKNQDFVNLAKVESPVSTLKRLATLRMKRSWQPDGSRMITPPLRTSSANSMKRTRTPPVIESLYEGNENQPQPKNSMWAKATALNRSTYGEGFKGFFR